MRHTAPGSTDLLPRQWWAPKTLYNEACFLLSKTGKIGQRTVLASTANSKHTVQSGKSGCKDK